MGEQLPQLFQFETSVVRLSDFDFYPLDQARIRWSNPQDRSLFGLGVTFLILYELKDQKYVQLTYSSCHPIQRDDPADDTPLWRSHFPPTGSSIDAAQAASLLVSWQFSIPENLRPVLETARQKAIQDANRTPRPLKYWLEHGYGERWSESSFESINLLMQGKKAHEEAVLLCSALREQKEGVRTLEFYHCRQLGLILFRRYTVRPEAWDTTAASLPAVNMSLSQLPWPEQAKGTCVALEKIRELLCATLASHHPSLKPGHPDYPTPEERQLIKRSLTHNLPALESLTLMLQIELGAWQESLKAKTDTPASPPPVPSEPPAKPVISYLGIAVDEVARIITRSGYEGKQVDLSGSPVAWSLFLPCFQAQGESVPLKIMVDGYAGEKSGRHSLQTYLNEQLKRLGLKLDHRRLIALTPKKKPPKPLRRDP